MAFGFPGYQSRRARRRTVNSGQKSVRPDRATQLETLEPRQLLARLIGIQPNDGELLEQGQVLNSAPTELTFRFDETAPALTEGSLAGQIRITRSGLDGIFGNANDVIVQPGFVGLGDQPNTAVVRFAETLPDDAYRIQAFDTVTRFELDLGAQVVAVVPQPVTRTATGLEQARDQVVVYFNNDDLDSTVAEDPRYYQLIFTNDTANNLDDVTYLPESVSYSAAGDRAVLTFANPIDELGSGPGTFRLRIGTDETAPLPPIEVDLSDDAGSSFDTSFDLGDLVRSQVVGAEIREEDLYPLDFPGGNNDPGHRDLPLESDNQHIPDLINPDGTRLPNKDREAGLATIGFVFRDIYGEDPFGQPLRNLITETQKQRTREMLSLYGEEIGAQFFEIDETTLPDLVNTDIEIFSIATGDMRAVDPVASDGPGGVVGIAGGVIDDELGVVIPTAIVDAAERFEDSFGGDWFDTMMGLTTYLMGAGYAEDLPPGTVTSDQVIAGYRPEPVFPSSNDIVHAQHLYRPEGQDIDIYRFDLTEAGLFTAETMAERQMDVSFLDTVLNLYREDDAGNRILIGRNDDYFSNDSFIEMELEPGTYYVGVSAAGNDAYDPAIEDSSVGGRTSGTYDLRLDFRPQVNDILVDATGTQFDGDADGLPGGVYDFWFRAQTEDNTLFVDKSAVGGGTGNISAPFNRINTAIQAADAGDIIRIVGNGGTDGDVSTIDDNFSYKIGFDSLSRPLEDGSTLEVPMGVTVMVDAGAILKMRRARVGVGSSTPRVDRSKSAFQSLGTPTQSVIFTSINDESIGGDSTTTPTNPAAGDWGGIVFRGDVDKGEGRAVYGDDAIFIDYVNNTDLLYGGGEVVIESVQQIVTPIQMVKARPTISFNNIERSADAALSADPDSFEESNFHDPRSQSVAFTSDVVRVGPDVHGNMLSDNSINGLFIRISTPAGNALRAMTVSGRWDDTDVVHVVSENLVIQGTAGGPQQNTSRAPQIDNVLVSPRDGGRLASGEYSYKFTYVLANGTETTPSLATEPLAVLGRGVQGQIVIDDLPITFQNAVTRRIFRSTSNGEGPYILVAETPLSQDTFIDTGDVINGEFLDERNLDLTARTNARLSIDPGTVVKLDGSHIDVTLGGDLYAEGQPGFPVVFTSVLDDRFGAGDTFDTRNDGSNSSPAPGDWGGIVARPMSTLSIDHGVINFGGGVTKVEGSFTGINAIEIQQAEARITNSTFANNADGTGGQAPVERFGRGFNAPGTIFIRGAQPIIVNNTIRDGLGPAISTNPGALSSDLVVDRGRATGELDLITDYGDNQGALIRGNAIGGNAVNGMVVRGEIVLNESVWDDTDIVHVVFEEIISPNFHTYGGIRLESNATGSLVVKFDGEQAGLTASGTPLDHDDRIGGTVQIVGQPGFPVVLTSIRDDSIGAGFDPEGRVQNDTDGNGSRLDPGSSLPTGPEVNNGTLIDNDVALTAPGAFQADPGAGGLLVPGSSSTTIQTQNAILQNQDYINSFQNLVDLGRDGGAIDLANTTITLQPTLTANDVVASEGFLTIPAASTLDQDQIIEWRVETYFENGDPTLFNRVTFRSDQPLGSIRLVNYFDPDVQGAAGDILLSRGAVGTSDFRAVTLDDTQRIGFGHGTLLDGQDNFVNASFAGWAGDLAPDLLAAATGAGGVYSIPGNIDQVDLVPVQDDDLGQVYGPGNVGTAFAWDVNGSAFTATMTSFVELIARNPTSFAGDWRGLQFDQYSNDRNVDILTEREPFDAEAPGVNGTPSTAQFLGELAPHLKAGDDNQRLGFQLDGYINAPSDVDVYSFRADGGTEVWIDIDRSTTALDTVVELVDANGTVLARSDNSQYERMGAESVLGLGRTMNRSAFENTDFYSTNIHDAGMRLNLPGAFGVSSTYHVRVRSSSTTINDTTAGTTRGAYQLQIRLQEMNEVPGSSVQYADIRNAVTGIDVLGLPASSPLLGELTEVDGDNQTRQTAQQIGNILQSASGGVTLVGSLTDRDDLDWYEFEIDIPDKVDTGFPQYASFTIDVDYTDGLARPNTRIYLFNDAGELIYSSEKSSVQDDRIAPTGPSALEDLSTGSGGGRDPFLGTITLQEGTYSMAVVSASYELDVLDDPNIRAEPLNSLIRIAEDRVGFAGGSNIAVDPAVPLLFTDTYSLITAPGYKISDGESFIVTNEQGESVTYEFDIDGDVRGRNVPIAYDPSPTGDSVLYTLYGEIDPDFLPGDDAFAIAALISDAIANNGPSGVTAFGGGLGGVTLDGARGVSTIPAPGSADPSLYVSKPSNVPFNLSDMTMFVTVDVGRQDNTSLMTIDPHTGAVENMVGVFGQNIEDLAMLPNGNLHGYTVPEGNPDNSNIGNYLLIDEASQTPNALSTQLADDGIQTFQFANGGVEDTEDGVIHQGMALGFLDGELRGFSIGNRGFANPPGVAGPVDNLLYEFDETTGVAFSLPTGQGGTDPPDREELARLEGGGTQIRERGQLDTTVDPDSTSSTLFAPIDATTISEVGVTQPRIIDGMQFTIDDPTTGTVFNFEFNSGPEVTYNYDPASGIFVRDGDTFLLDGRAYEFDTGSVLLVEALNGTAIVDGQSLAITDNQGQLRIFEFDDGSGAGVDPERVAIPFSPALDQSQLAATIINSINSVGNFNIEASLLPNSNRISLRGESTTVGVISTAPAIAVVGAPGGAGDLIRVEENASFAGFGQAVANAIPGAGADGTRLNFSNAVIGSFPQLISRGIFQVNAAANGTVTQGFIGVPFQADDTGVDIAGRITNAINSNTILTATQTGDAVDLAGTATFTSAESPLRIGGTAPGGNFTGLSIINGTLYGVTGPDRFGQGGGGLFVLEGPRTNNAVANYVDSATDLLTGGRDAFGVPTGGPIEFSSLTPGPNDLQDGRFAETLFALDVYGNLYAMDLQGNLLPVFMGSQTSVQIQSQFGGPLGGQVTGFAFSTLDVNLWHVTSERREDDGHGWEEAPDGSRRAENDAGNTSLRFGFNEPGNTPGSWGNHLDPGIRDSYDFPGGAHGSIESNTFSLRDFGEGDTPVLYFNYFADTEQAEGDIAPPPFMRDSFRVFVSSDDGEWQLVATNNSFRGTAAADDEFDYGPFAVVELDDASGQWGQVRVDLSPYAGLDNLRLRFDFSTAGSYDIGNSFTGGDELRAVAGNLIADGDFFSVADGSFFGGGFGGAFGLGFADNFFEFDLGFTIDAISGTGLSDGQTVTLSDGINAPVTVEMDLGDGVAVGNVPMPFHTGMSAAEVAVNLEAAIMRAFGNGVERVDLLREQNDTISQPVLSEFRQGYVLSNGTIGDNPQLFGALAGRDVDMLQVDLRAGQLVTVDIDTDGTLTSLFDSQLRVFNSEGVEIAANNNGAAPTEGGFTFDSYLEFTAPTNGAYFIAVSGGGNTLYDPFVQGSGLSGATGDYRLEVRMVGIDSPVDANLRGTNVNLENVVSISMSPGTKFGLVGEPGTTIEGAHPVYVHPNMSDDEVAIAVREAIATAFGTGNVEGIPGHADVVRLFGHSVVDPGPLGLSLTGFPLADGGVGVDPDDPFDLDLDTNGLDGDEFGAFNASSLADGATNNDFPGFLRGWDNDFEGVYIDDIIIGFGERGEMYTSAPALDTFTRVPDPDIPTTEILTGDYQIEFRSSAAYGAWDPPGLPTLILTEAYDPRERLTEAVSIAAPAGADAADGMTFRVGDGTAFVTLEYDNFALRNGVKPGNIPIVVSTAFTAAEVANEIRDVINSPQVQALIDVRAESAIGSDEVDLYGNAVVETGFNPIPVELDESNDTLATAIDTGIAPDSLSRFAAEGTLGDNPVVGPGLDVDLVKFDLEVGQRVAIDIDSVNLPVDTMLRLFDAAGNQLAISDDDPAPGEEVTREAYLTYTASVSGTYFAGVSGYSNQAYDPTEIGSGTVGGQGDYTMQIVVGSDRDAVTVIKTSGDRFGDSNIKREQGSLVIHSSRISNSATYGVSIDAATRTGDGNIASPGSPLLLFEENDAGLAPGVVVKNNVISYNRDGAIRYSGDPFDPTMPEASVPFGRIVNNTLVGGRPSSNVELLENLPLGTGIDVEENVSPTILNNIITNFRVGIDVDTTSTTTVIGGNLYQSNTINSTAGLGDFPILLRAGDPLFVDMDEGNFNLAANSQAIDSSIDSLEDRPAIISVSEPLGIEVSPILAPEFDVTGQLRVDDPSVDTPAGFGNNVFKDRGAIDRADFLGPQATLTNPRDNDAAGVDRNPTNSVVQINNPVVRSFNIQLNDGVTETQRQAGTGVDSDTVTRDRVRVFRTGVLLQEGVDYIFSYNATSRVIRLTPLTGIWEPGRVYEIVLDNTNIRDLANNAMQANRDNGSTAFTVAIGGEDQDFGDAPAPYPTLLLDDGPSHVIDDGFHLGDSVDSEPNGLPTAAADGDGADDDGIVFVDPLVPGRSATISIVASEAGFVDGWLDLNQDGSWDDVGEQIFTSISVTAGTTLHEVSLPESTPLGTTYARFRLSKQGGLAPTGLALDGEVEDYRVSIVTASPWHNELNPFDVDQSNTVVPLDALLLINELNARNVSDRTTGLLPNPPVAPNTPDNLAFYDVNADGYLNPLDALLVINQLNSPAPVAAVAAIEAEGEPSSHDGIHQHGDNSLLIAAALLTDAEAGVDDKLHANVVDELVGEQDEKPQTLELGETYQVFDDPRFDDEFEDDLEGLAEDVALSSDDDESLV